MAIMRSLLSISILGGAVALAACASPSSGPEDASGGAGGAASASSSSGASAGEHGCFSTEATCGGKCVDLSKSTAHCGACDNACASAADRTGTCVDGSCAYQCNAGFVDEQGSCKNFFGGHEAFPNDCQGCSTANQVTGACGCPSPSTEISLAVQSDCPAQPLRSATRLNLCVTPGVSADSDFGGAYQVDDLDGWCGSTAKCRVGNPLAGGACACPPGLDDAIALRSIVRLPCDGGEAGTLLVICGNKDVPIRSYGGAFQVDDLEPTCRVANPWTGGCSCPAGTAERVFRVMVDGGAGLYGSTVHLCTP